MDNGPWEFPKDSSSRHQRHGARRRHLVLAHHHDLIAPMNKAGPPFDAGVRPIPARSPTSSPRWWSYRPRGGFLLSGDPGRPP